MVNYFQVTVESGSAFQSVESVEKYLQADNIERFFENKIEGYLRERGRDRFAKEGDDASGPWTPLRRATLKVKKSEGVVAHGINVRTGQLMMWATEGTFDTQGQSGNQTFTYPKKKPTGKLLNKARGAQMGEGTAPPRPVIALGQQDAIMVLERFASYFDEVLK